ncbi:inorganic phosphate transporter [Amycolatopsis sp. PS_44_ISF1]|uniref:inorganic phosphate transporter n=1 Tax=Amycolatopsis sp. PS_44_ISF1 TaxID=2974917 RepID=UPI0028DFB945|nr:inorganic phosphate transporter [Amycolatopsis sp. PS_44_ISF1]MDT8911639.1 inorganic phosphate transporter [Amycolatopsis sp. PS_44_ISF1]
MTGPAALVAVIVLTVFFDYTNGFHDAANAIASAVSTRALGIRPALALAAVMNLAGALLSTGIAATVAKGIIDVPADGSALTVVFAALVGAITWNLVTWYFGLPSSSSHSLVGGMVGAALAAAGTVHWAGIAEKVLIPMIVSPLLGLGLGYLVMVGVLWLLRRANSHRVGRNFRRLQVVSAAGLALGHGLQDAQKGMGIIVLALVAAGAQSSFAVPLWVTLLCAAALSLGTYSGGMRIMRTLGRRVFPLDPPHGFVAESVASSVLYLTAFVVKAPISTTHVITAAIMGVGATRRVSAVRWGVARDIVLGWVLTFPAAAAVAAAACLLIRAVT